MLLRSQSAGHILRAIHHAAALVIEAQNGRHHIRAAFRCFQRRRALLLIPDTTGLAALTSGEGSSQHTGVTLSCLPTSSSQCRVPFLGKEAIPIALGHNSFRHEGLLFHSRLCAQRASQIVQIPHLVPLIGGKGHDAIPAGGHPTVDAERGRYIAGQIAVVAVKALHSIVRLRHEGLHLHIRRCQQCAGHAVQVDALVPLVDVVRF